jgi:CheY-like chemotaxis protein
MDRVADAPAISEGQKATDTLQSTRQDTHPHKPHYTPMLPLRLLLAEDNTSSQRVVLRLLEHLDYRADVAASGTEVMEAMERQQYDVILMDAHMPEMDGPETARAIRVTIPPNQQPWIIAMVAPTMPRSPDWLRISGMNDELRKPVRLEELKQALIRAPRLSSRISRIADVTLDSATVERFLSTVGHENPVVMRNLVDTFLNDTCEKITMMHQALEQQRLDHLARLARSIISNSRQIGALALATLCRDIEATAEGNMNDQMYEHAREHIRRAREEYARVREALVQQVLVFSRYHAVANR